MMRAAKLEPLDEYPGASKPWRCVHLVCGREVTPSFTNVRRGHNGCKYCVGNIVDSVKATQLFISKGLLPLEPYRNALVGWRSIHQKCGREVSPKFNNVQQGGSGCQFCAGNLPLNPEDAKRFFISKGLWPQEVFISTARPWKCIHEKCGRVVFPTYATVQQGSSGCKYCAGVYVDPKEALDFFENLGFLPLESYQTSQTPLKSIHINCGKVVTPTYSSLKSGSSGCVYCAGNKVEPKEAENLFLERGLIPQEPFPGASVGWRSIHTLCGLEVFPKYKYVSTGSSGCKDCSSTYVNPDYAIDVFRAADLEPLEPYPGSNTGWRSIHTVCGREVQPRWGYVKRFNSGCKYCAGRAVTESDAVKRARERGFEPVKPFPGTGKPWQMIHIKCGRAVEPRLNSLEYNSSDASGCVLCADSTFNYDKPSIIYLITHEELGAHKIGITGAEKNRIEQHKREGWVEFRSKELSTGLLAYNIEQEVLQWLRDELGLTPFLSKNEMPQGGYSETIDGSEIDLGTIWLKVLSFVEEK